MQAQLEVEEELPAEQQLIYSIVNAFLAHITFHNTQAEELLVAALQDETHLTPLMHQHIKEMFLPIFIHYPNGLNDRSVCEPLNCKQFIHEWKILASMRERLLPTAAATEHGHELSKEQVTQIFQQYMDDFKKDLRPDQRRRKWGYYKSCTEAKMKRKAGHVFLANAIWTIGLPQLPSSATEQQSHDQLSAQNLQDFPEAIYNVLEWLDRIATARLEHCASLETQEAVRKSGVMKGESGLSNTEKEIRRSARKARYDMRTAKNLAQQWQKGTLTNSNSYPWQRELLQDYSGGLLHARVKAIV